MTDAIISLAAWCLILPCAYLAGSFCESMLKESDRVLRGILFVALGFGFFVYFLLFIGNFGYLKRPALILPPFVIFLLRWRRLPEFWEWLRGLLQTFFYPGNTFEKLCQMIFAATFVITALACFFPEISNDALAHVLNIPKRFVQTGWTRTLPYDLRSYPSLFMNCLYAVGLLLHQVSVAKFFHWWTGILLTAAVILVIQRETGKRPLALFFGLLLWLTPTLMNQVTNCYNDGAVAFYVFLSFTLLLREKSQQELMKPVFASGLLMGFAVSIKYMAVIAVFSAAGVFFAKIFREKKARWIQRCAVYGSGFWIGVGFWFLRSWITTGNPFFPFFDSLFGGKVSPFMHDTYLHGMGLPRNVATYALAAVNVTFRPQYFDFHHWIGPFYFLMLPAALFSMREKRARPYLFAFFLYANGWYFLAQNVRYLLPGLPLFLVAAAIGLRRLQPYFQGMIQGSVTAAAVGLSLGLFALAVFHFRYQLAAFAQRWSRQTYLERMERTSGIAEWVNANLPGNSKIMSHEVRIFYFDRDILWDEMLYRSGVDLQGKSKEESAAILKKLGFTHLLDMQRAGPKAESRSERSAEPLDMILSEPKLAQPLVKIKSQNIKEGRFFYTVYELSS